VIGQNGSGKSTLLGLIARVYRPTAGVLEVNGRVAPLLELGAGFHPDLTGLENIYFNGVILGLTRKQIAERLDAIVQFAELEGYIDAPIRTYSSGMLMRLGFAVAAHVDADILLVDEVLAVGDARFQQKCYDKIRQFQREGRTILFVSHDMEAITQVAARALWLGQGHPARRRRRARRAGMVNGNLRKGHAVVLGAGTMGSGIAALLASIGWRVHLLDQGEIAPAHWNAAAVGRVLSTQRRHANHPRQM
jgi:ABC-type polysaccharide/polyol phosphate transport system ATPase subunit